MSAFPRAAKEKLEGQARRLTVDSKHFDYRVGKEAPKMGGGFATIRSLDNTTSPMVLRKLILGDKNPEAIAKMNAQRNKVILQGVYGHEVTNFEYRKSAEAGATEKNQILTAMPHFGEHLKTWVTSHPDASFSRKLKIAQSMTLALTKLHAAGWVHHDFKSVNVMIDNTDKVQLIDFDTAKQIGASSDDEHTMLYTAPELQSYYFDKEEALHSDTAFDKKILSNPSFDHYALGVSFIDLFTTQSGFIINFDPSKMTTDEFLKGKHFETTKISKDFQEIHELIKQLISPTPEGRPTLSQTFETLSALIAKERETEATLPSESEKTVLRQAEQNTKRADKLHAVYSLIRQEEVRLKGTDTSTKISTLRKELEAKFNENTQRMKSVDTEALVTHYSTRFGTIAREHLPRHCFTPPGGTTLFKHYQKLSEQLEQKAVEPT